MGRRIKNISGRKYSRLTAVSPTEKRASNGVVIWYCLCECGGSNEATKSDLQNKRVQSCGCLIGEGNITHGMTGTPEFKAWCQALDRCHNPNHKQWDYYGGRGIEVAPEWRDDFVEFYEHIGPRPTNEHSLDRIDNNEGYKPGNVRWATKKQQAMNRRSRYA